MLIALMQLLKRYNLAKLKLQNYLYHCLPLPAGKFNINSKQPSFIFHLLAYIVLHTWVWKTNEIHVHTYIQHIHIFRKQYNEIRLMPTAGLKLIVNTCPNKKKTLWIRITCFSARCSPFLLITIISGFVFICFFMNRSKCFWFIQDAACTWVSTWVSNNE